MIYRETGQFKSSYASDQAIFPIVQDRIFVLRAAPSQLRIRFRYSSMLLAGSPAASFRLTGGDVVTVD